MITEVDRLNRVVSALLGFARPEVMVLTAADINDVINVAVRLAAADAAAQDIHLLFTPYFTTKSSGTGLGLAIVHQIVKGHGGDITVSSRLGEGSKFTLLLPLGNTHSKISYFIPVNQWVFAPPSSHL